MSTRDRRALALTLRLVASGYDTVALVAYATDRTETSVAVSLLNATRNHMLRRWRENGNAPPGPARTYHYELTPAGANRLAWYTEQGL